MRLAARVAETLGVQRGPAMGFLGMCLFATAAFVVAHLAYRLLGVPHDKGFGLGQERGYGSIFFVIETAWAIGLLVLVAVMLRAPVLFAWATAFGYLLLDDWYELHEQMGGTLARGLGVIHHLGELLWLLGTATALGVVVLVLHLLSRGDARAVSAVLFALALALLLCGALADFMHGMMDSDTLQPYVIALEDGGEIAVMSVVVAFLYAVAFTGHRPRVGQRWGTLFGIPAELRRPR
jgi:hypothetical protein